MSRDVSGFLETNRWIPTLAGILFSLPVLGQSVSLVERLARLFREPTAESPNPQTNEGPVDAYRGDGGTGGGRDDGGGEAGTPGSDTESGSQAVAVVVQAPPAGVRRFELTVRSGVPVERVEPGLLSSLFETFDEANGVVRARSVDVDGNGKDVDAAASLFTVWFAEPVDPETVSIDGTLTGHDEEPVPWSRVRLTPVE